MVRMYNLSGQTMLHVMSHLALSAITIIYEHLVLTNYALRENEHILHIEVILIIIASVKNNFLLQ